MNQESEMQIIPKQLAQIQGYLESLEEQIRELSYAIKGIEQLQNIKENQEMLAPLTNGIFVESKIVTTKKLLVNVGSEYLVEKTPQQTMSLLDEQKKELESYHETMMAQASSLYRRFLELRVKGESN